MNLSDVAGPITVEGQNGAVTVAGRTGQKCQPISLRTTFSPIRVTLPQSQGFNVTAHTTFGHIHTDPNVVTTVSGNVAAGGLTGKINGGGCDLRLIGENGNIDILQ